MRAGPLDRRGAAFFNKVWESYRLSALDQLSGLEVRATLVAAPALSLQLHASASDGSTHTRDFLPTPQPTGRCSPGVVPCRILMPRYPAIFGHVLNYSVLWGADMECRKSRLPNCVRKAAFTVPSVQGCERPSAGHFELFTVLQVCECYLLMIKRYLTLVLLQKSLCQHKVRLAMVSGVWAGGRFPHPNGSGTRTGLRCRSTYRNREAL